MINKLKRNYFLFKDYGKSSGIVTTKKMYIQFLFLKIRCGVGVYDYFNNRLYDRSVCHDDFYASLHKNIHKWKNVSKKYCEGKSRFWLFVHKIDYLFSKLIYPGLDAMDYFRYEFYNFCHAKRKTFITEGRLAKMDKVFNGGCENKDALDMLSSKVKFNTLFADYMGRKWIDAEHMTLDKFEEFCHGLEKVIVKPIDSCGGNGIYICDLKDNKEKLFQEVCGKHFIIEELLLQHQSIQKINPASVNTIRVYTVLKNNTVTITAAVFRIGNGSAPTDNYSAGGMAAKIDVDTGLLVSRAVMQNAKTTYVHPVTKQPIIGFQIPCWEEVKKQVVEAHRRIEKLRYVAWDVVVCRDERIVFLEANTFGGVELQQHPTLEGKLALYNSLM